MLRFSLRLTTFCVLFGSYFLFTAALSLGQSTLSIIERWSTGQQMSVYLADGVSDSDANEIALIIKKYPEFEAQYVPTEMALAEFKKNTQDVTNMGLAEEDLASIITSRFDIKASQDALLSGNWVPKVEGLAQALKSSDLVDEIVSGVEWTKKYVLVIKVIQGLGIAVFSVLIAVLTLVVGNAIRDMVAGRREQIEVLELLGASHSMIAKPFILEGITLSFLSMLLAFAAVNLGSWYLTQHFKLQLGIWGVADLMHPPLVSQFLKLSILSLGIGAIGSWLVVRSYNTGWSAARRTGP